MSEILELARDWNVTMMLWSKRLKVLKVKWSDFLTIRLLDYSTPENLRGRLFREKKARQMSANTNLAHFSITTPTALKPGSHNRQGNNKCFTMITEHKRSSFPDSITQIILGDSW